MHKYSAPTSDSRQYTYLIFFDAQAVDILRMVDEEEYGVVWARYNGENSGASHTI